jgi:hypothetical protein
MLRSGFVHSMVDPTKFLQVVWKHPLDSIHIVQELEHDYRISEDDLLTCPIHFQVLVGKSKTEVLLHLHHALYDGWSVELMVDDLHLIVSGDSPSARPSYGLVQQYYEYQNTESSLDYWQSQLADCTPTLLLTQKGNQEAESITHDTATSMEFPFPAEKVKSFAVDLGVSPQSIFQTAYFCVLSLLVANSDLMMGAVTSGRMLPISGVEKIIGPCMTTLPLRAHLGHARLVKDLIRSVHVLNRRLVEHADASMLAVRRACRIAPGAPLTDALFIWQETLNSTNTRPLDVRLVDSLDTVEYKLVLEVEPIGSSIVGKLSSHANIMSSTEAENLLQQIGSLCDHMISNAESNLVDLPVSSRQGHESTSWTSLIEASSNLSNPQPSVLIRHEENDDNANNNNEIWTDSEVAIRKAISQLTAVPEHRIRRGGSIFRHGVDSITAIALSKLLREQGFSNSSVAKILQNGTIASLASSLADNEGTAGRGPPTDQVHFPENNFDDILQRLLKQKLDISKILPCTPLQEAMLSASHSGHSEAYWNTMLFKVNGDLSMLRAAWDTVLRRHEIFRVIFSPAKHSEYPFVQAILKNWDQWWTTTPNPHERDKLDGRPPVSLCLLEINSTKFVQFSCHHAIYDAAAMQQVIIEVEAAYKLQSLPPPVPIEMFLDVSLSHRSDTAIISCVDALRGFEPTNWKASATPEFDTLSLVLEPSLQRIERFFRGQSASLLSLSQATMLKLLSQVLGTTDVCFGNIVSGRTSPIGGLERLVFPTFNTVPVRFDLSGTGDIGSMLQQLQQLSGSMEAYNLAPLRKIQQATGYSRSGLFSVLLIVQLSDYTVDENIWSLVSDTGVMNVS